MTTSDNIGGYSVPPAASGRPLLRRSRTNRVAAGVCSGLGEYFGLDPVLFRVLFATAAFFGGAGILAYLLAWAAIPDAGTAHAPIDRFIAWMRRRRFPMWLAAAVAAVLVWAVAFSWWGPAHFFPVFPVLAIVVLLIVFYGRREMQANRTAAPTEAAGQPDAAASVGTDSAASVGTDSPVDLTKPGEPTASGDPTWVRDARGWFDEAREASRRRRRRSLPLRIAMISTLAVALTVLGLIDAFSGVELQVYFWTALGILGVGLLAGIITRRTPLSMTPLLILSIIGAVAFGGSHASLHDGIGQREWKPTVVPSSGYRLAFGQGILDLRALPAQAQPRTIDVTMGAGQVQVIAPKSMNLTVLANIHFGQLEVDGRQDSQHSGVGISRQIGPPAKSTGVPITVDVHLANGNITVNHG
jgi:phage shock protein PspC (stress-responsive transcriptional regulator)/FtsH-binding integral membrane protein